MNSMKSYYCGIYVDDIVHDAKKAADDVMIIMYGMMMSTDRSSLFHSRASTRITSMILVRVLYEYTSHTSTSIYMRVGAFSILWAYE